MQVKLNEDGYVNSYAEIGGLLDGVEIEPPDDLDHFEVNFKAYKANNGILTYDEGKDTILKSEAYLADLRNQRQYHCFPYINRGELWYETLSETEVEELDAWYKAWLDVTETFVIPEKPVWLI